MFIHFEKAAEPDGKTVRAVKLLDYSSRCEKPFDLPLREHLLWSTARYADLHGEFPDGETRFDRRHGRYTPGAFRPDDKDREEETPPLDSSTVWRNGAASGEALLVRAELERVRVACGSCHWCTNERRRRWERAAKGWIESSPLTCFGTLTFSEQFFSTHWNLWIDRKLEEGSIRSGEPGFDQVAWYQTYTALRTDRYNPDDVEHNNFMRRHLTHERQKMFKRLRRALDGDPRFDGVRLKAHLSVFEVGDLRGRLHVHFLAHFDVGELPVGSAYSRLRKFLKENWHNHGIGFVDVKQATPEDGVETARYICQYLLSYHEEDGCKRVRRPKGARLACSLGYRSKGTELWFAAHPSIIPGGSLRPADPVPLDERDGFPLSSGDADLEDLQLSSASQKLTLEEVPAEFRQLAEEIARANLAWRDGELWPGWSTGLDMPEDHEAELPPSAIEFAGWLLGRSYKDDRRFPPPGDVPPWVTEDCSSAHPDSINITGEFFHPGTGEPFTAAQWFSFTNSERVAISVGVVPPWWKDGDPPPLAGAGAEGDEERSGLPVPSSPRPKDGEVLGPTLSQRAMKARGLGLDTFINRRGEYRRHPDDDLRGYRKLVRNADGSFYDAETGEIVLDARDIEDIDDV